MDICIYLSKVCEVIKESGNQRLIEDIGIVWGFLQTIVKERHATRDCG